MSDQTASEVASRALDDDEFIATFERGGFGGDAFPHQAHVRMAWLYVTRLGPQAAIDRAAEGIHRLAMANGREALYHDTVTRAWVYLVADAIANSPSAELQRVHGAQSSAPREAAPPRVLLAGCPFEFAGASHLDRPGCRADPRRARVECLAGSETDPTPTVAAADCIAAFRAVPTAVAVMAATDGVNVHGMTASSVTSLSMDPPLVLVCVQGGSRILPMIRDVRAFQPFLPERSATAMSRPTSHPRRALRGPPSSTGSRTAPDDLASPSSTSASAWLTCELWCEYPGGDHAIVCGLVRDAFGGDAHPLLSFARQLL